MPTGINECRTCGYRFDTAKGLRDHEPYCPGPAEEPDEATGERLRTEAEEAAHERRMEEWARRYDELDGAPESEEDR